MLNTTLNTRNTEYLASHIIGTFRSCDLAELAVNSALKFETQEGTSESEAGVVLTAPSTNARILQT
jgi:hypothetical protein